MTRIVSFVRSAAVAAGVSALAAGAAGAQPQAGGWQGWLGCWTAGPAIGGIAPSALAPLVCITPTPDANVVEVTTISGDKVVSTQRIDAGGRDLPMDAKGCTGTQRGQWSADGRRVYLKAVARCEGVERTTSGIIAMSPTGEWLDVQGVSAGSDEGVRVARYRDAGVPSVVPAALAASLRDRAVATQAARFAVGATIGSTAVIEASRSVSPAVVEAWLMERGQVFALDAAELVRLADAGVPARVTDAMIAVSNPKVFATTRAEARSRTRADDEIVGRRIYVTMDPTYSPYRWGYTPYGYSYYGYGYGPYGYSPLGYGGSGYGSGYAGYPGYVPPVVILNPTNPSQGRGQAVRGRGYTQPDPNTATPASTSRGSEGSSSSGSSSSQPRSEPARSEPAPAPRTAHPRP